MYAYRTLSPGDPQISAHFLALSPSDRRCRFHGPTSDQRIAQYCAEMTRREAHLVGCLEGERLIGLIEIVFCGEGEKRFGEVGMSVAADARGQGIGSRLVEHALEIAANRRIPLVFGYLPDNACVPRIICTMGGSVDPIAAEGQIEPPRKTPFTLCLEAMDDMGLVAAQIISMWKKAALTPLEEAAQLTAHPSY